MYSVCLNMIVKNESKIITRLFDSVLPIIDSYCICDTGSTDDTEKIITSYMEKNGIPGEVIKEPFKNFGYNRTFALKAAKKWGKYALLLDADMILKVEDPSFFKNKDNLKKDGYAFLQKAGDVDYYNIRLVRTDIGVTCVGPTHEHYDFAEGHKDIANLDNVFIQDIGDGGAKSDKFERDVRLLEEALVQDPNNPRTYFYLANSYKSLKRYEEAIKSYKRRIEIGGWEEEVFYARYEIGNCFKEQARIEEAIYWYIEAYNHYPRRAETLFEIVHYYRNVGKNVAAKLFCDQALRIPYPKDDCLFIKSDVYNYKLEYENSIISYYTKSKINHFKYLKLFGYDDVRDSAISNYKFYAFNLCDEFVENGKKTFDFTETIENGSEKFYSSTPCIIKISGNETFKEASKTNATPTTNFTTKLLEDEKDDPNEILKPVYLMNIRFVNYRIKDSGDYEISDVTGKISTIQKIVLLNKDFKEINSTFCSQVIGDVGDKGLRYQGVEDLKMISVPESNNTIFTYVGTVQDPKTLSITVGGGVYPVHFSKILDPDVNVPRMCVKVATSLHPIAYKSPLKRECEKNWCLFESNKRLKVVYEWFPLEVYDYDILTGLSVNHKKTYKVPEFFKVLRGSSNGSYDEINNEIWFMTHFVEYSKPRHYYHMIVSIDAKTNEYKRHSSPFKFEGSKIEYSLGLVVETERIVMSYSCNDASSKVISLSRMEVEARLFSQVQWAKNLNDLILM